MQKVKKYIKVRFLGIFIEMLERFVRVFSTVTICLNWEIISNAYSDAALLQETANRNLLFPVCQTLFQLDKNNLDRIVSCRFFPLRQETGWICKIHDRREIWDLKFISKTIIFQVL
jgi:hypothetical protein